MRKYRLFTCLAVLSFLFVSCGGGGGNTETEQGDETVAEKKMNDLQKERINGNVKTIRQRVYWSLEKFGRIEKGKLQNLKQHDFLKVYNEKGFLVEETHFDVSDKEVSKNIITYNSDDQIIKEELTLNGKPSTSTTYTYENGLLKQKETLDEKGNLKEKYGYTYYENGLLMDEDRFGPNAQLVQKNVYKYNDKGLVSEKASYWGGGSPFRTEKYVYDNKGNITAVNVDKFENREPYFDGKTEFTNYNTFKDYLFKNVYNKDNEKVEVNEYVYDGNGNLTSHTVRKLQEKMIDVVVINEDPEWEESDADIDDDIDEYIIEDNNGAEIENTVIQEKVTDWIPGLGAAYDYTYDEQHNWTAKITYKIEKEEKIRQFYYERIIEYR